MFNECTFCGAAMERLDTIVNAHDPCDILIISSCCGCEALCYDSSSEGQLWEPGRIVSEALLIAA